MEYSVIYLWLGSDLLWSPEETLLARVYSFLSRTSDARERERYGFMYQHLIWTKKGFLVILCLTPDIELSFSCGINNSPVLKNGLKHSIRWVCGSVQGLLNKLLVCVGHFDFLWMHMHTQAFIICSVVIFELICHIQLACVGCRVSKTTGTNGLLN